MILERLRAAWGPGAGRRLALDVPLGLLVLLPSVLFLRAAQWEKGPAFDGAHGGPRPPWGENGGPVEGVEFLPVAFPAAVVIAVAVMLRRFHPRSAFVTAALATAVFAADTGFHGPFLFGMVVTLYTMVSRMPVRDWAPWTLAVVPVLLSTGTGRPYLGLGQWDTYASMVPHVLLVLAVAAVGVMVRGRRENAKREWELELRRSAYAERLRIAREVHDVVGHSLSVISMQAGVALHVLDKRPDHVRESLSAIRTTSKDALEELRGTLAVFREADTEGEHGDAADSASASASAPASGDRAPLPGLERTGELAARMRAAGQRVAVHTEGTAAAPPAAVDHAAYRIVQEALTNVVRHAPGARAAVRIAYERTEVVVEIENDGSPAGAAEPAEGSGIAGMRERARAVGGALHAGPRPGGGFTVRARLPLGAPRSGR